MNKKKYQISLRLSILALLFFGLFFKWNENRTRMDDVASYYISQLQNGDFSCLVGSEVVTREEILYSYKRGTKTWKRCDVNKDGIDELILQEEEGPHGNDIPIVGVFAAGEKGMKCVLWDTADSTEYFFIGAEGTLVYVYKEGGQYTAERYYRCEVNKAFQREVVDGLIIYNFGDGIEVDKERWKESHPELSGMQIEGVHYTKYKP